MNKKLLAVAVAGALAAPGFAMAQSSVTISGILKGSLDQFSIGNANTARTGNLSETRVSDHSSRIIFNMTEDLGGGLKAIGQFDLRFNLDQTSRLTADYTTATTTATMAPSVNPVSSGNNHVGLAGSWGSVKLGRQDIYYVDTASVLPASAHIGTTAQPIFHSLASMNASRTPNLAWYESPRMSGVRGIFAYSTNPIRASGTNEAENDLGTNSRKGGGVYAKLDADIGNANVFYSFVNAKSDYTGGTMSAAGDSISTTQNVTADQKGRTFGGTYNFGGGLKAGLGFSTEKSISVATGSTTKANAGMASIAYTTAAHTIGYEYTKVGDKSVDGLATAGSNAKGSAFVYDYAFSKRTNIGATYYQLANGSAGTIGPFYQGNNAFGGQYKTLAGEKYTITSVVLRHAF